MLLRLALAETEPHLGNNASSVWQSLFRIFLSGTPLPFVDRLPILEARLRAADPTQRHLALEALDEILTDGPGARLAAPPMLFGRLPPPEWRPASNEERRACRSLALAMAACCGRWRQALRMTSAQPSSTALAVFFSWDTWRKLRHPRSRDPARSTLGSSYGRT